MDALTYALDVKRLGAIVLQVKRVIPLISKHFNEIFDSLFRNDLLVPFMKQLEDEEAVLSLIFALIDDRQLESKSALEMALENVFVLEEMIPELHEKLSGHYSSCKNESGNEILDILNRQKNSKKEIFLLS